MRFATATRMLRAATGVLLLCLLPVLNADAAPRAHRTTHASLCDVQTLTLKKLRRQPKAFGGPLKRVARNALAPVIDMSSRLRRGTHALLGEDEAAIQNDAPAASFDDDEQPVPALRPLGLLHGTLDQHPHSATFSPRSPRGPPSYV
jgi:hypothetical protein